MVVERKIPAGYKMTEVGVVPEDWEAELLGGLVSISTGSKNTQDKIEGGLYPFFVRSALIERIDSYSFDGEAVLTAGDGVGTGKVFHYINGKFDYHQRVYKMNEFNKRLDGYYFYLYFSNNFLNRIKNMTAKSSVDSVRMDMISKMLVLLPPLSEQKAISQALIDIDGLIASIETLIDKKQKIKQGVMQELLTGKRRLPGFKVEWEIKRLGDIAEISMGQSPDSVYYNTQNIGMPLIQGKADLVNRRTIIRYFTSHITKTALIDDLIMTVRAPVGYIARAQFSCCIGRGVCSIRYVNKYLYFYLLFIENDWDILSRGSTFDAVNAIDVKNIEIKLPSDLKEQQAIAQVLTDMDDEIDTLEEKLDKYKNIKQGMMQELLTGRIRLI